MIMKGNMVDTSFLFRSDFYRQADELAVQLQRVEAAWADRFEPSWMIFMPSPSLMWQAIGQSFVDGFGAGIKKAEWLMRVTAEIRMALYGRRWFRALPRWARHWVVRRLVQTQARPEDATAAPGLSRGAFLALSERIARRAYWTLYDEDDEEE